MDYKKADEQLQGRNNQRRKLENNTYLERHDDYISVRLHDTDIIELYPDGKTVLNTGGWRTVTTKDRLNKFAPDTIRGHIRISQEKRVWYVIQVSPDYDWSKAVKYIFRDSFTYNSKTGEISEALFNPSNGKAVNKVKRQISNFAKAYMIALDSGDVPAPSNGDCFYCAMRDTNGTGKTLGELNGHADHILNHFEENYFVPSLMARAVEMFPVSIATKNWYLAGLWDKSADEQTRATAIRAGRGIGQEQLKRALVRYLSRQLGLAS